MGDNLARTGCRGCLLRIDEAEIAAHESDDPNAFVDVFDCGPLAGKDGRDVDALSIIGADGPRRAALRSGRAGGMPLSIARQKNARSARLRALARYGTRRALRCEWIIAGVHFAVVKYCATG